MDPFRANYRDLTVSEKIDVEDIKRLATDLYRKYAALDASRERSLAMTKLEESVMWAVKHITA